MYIIIQYFKYYNVRLLLSTKSVFKEMVYLSTLFFKCRLGATSLMELMIATGKAVPKLQVEHGLAVDRVYTGSFMTSLDMEGLLPRILVRRSVFLCMSFSSSDYYIHFPSGFSISIMRADPTILQRLDAETKAPYWPVGVSGRYFL